MDRIRMLTVMPIVVALMIGLQLTQGFHVAYKAADRAMGIVKIAPWAQRLSAMVAAPTLTLSQWFGSGWFRAREGIAVAALLGVVALGPDADVMTGLALFGTVGTAVATNTALLERELVEKKTKAAALFAKYSMAAQAHEETVVVNGKETTVKGRLLTDDEKKEVQAAIDDANKIKAMLDGAKGDAAMAAEIEKLTAGMTPKQVGNVDATFSARRAVKSLGQQWAESAAGKYFFEKRHQGSRNWQSPSVELTDHHLQAATLTSDLASGGDLIVPDYRPGILPLLFKRLTIRDLIAPGRTESNMIKYMVETTFTNAAATVAEGAAKPESTLIFDITTDEVEKIAHWLPVTEEMLEDVSQIRSYIDARLRLGVQLTEEDQLLNGDGTTPNISGILDRTGLTAAQARGTDTNADAIFKEMMKIFNASFLMPDAHVINPTNWQTIQLAKDANGQYYGSGPFAGPQAPTLWGLPVSVTPSIAAGTALSGAFRQASQIFDKGGIRVEASNSHSDYFIKNLVAIRAEERLALAVYRPAAFGTTTGLN